jgi:S-methylmethionine-dependent homocysteine/selenocysteine methylase
MKLKERLQQQKPILLDGALGTELQRHGFHVRAPLWTAEPLLTSEGQQAIATIHSRYAKAGAEIITIDSFRTNNYTIKNSGFDLDASTLTAKAAELARKGIAEANVTHRVFLAGSMTTVGDCYQPSQIPAMKTAIEDHTCSVRNLVNAGVDFILAETINSSLEAEIILSAAREAGAEVAISFVCDREGKLLNGESLSNVVPRLLNYHPIAILVNCTDFQGTEAALRVLRDFSGDLPIGAYPNVENRDNLPEHTHVDCYLEPKFNLTEYADFMYKLIVEYQIKIIGGCCGTNPQHIEKINSIIASIVY